MNTIDFTEPSELFVGRRGFKGRSTMKYHRFDTCSEAVRFAVEELSPQERAGAAIETENHRFEAADIVQLYARADFPLPKRVPARAAP
jgi:hypothetical protein